MAASERLQLQPTQPLDLDFVLSAEAHPDNAAYVGQWSRQRHRQAIDAPNEGHFLLVVGPRLRPVGYTILIGLADHHQSLQIRRLVVAEKGRGYGRQALRQIKQAAFETWGVHRLWLDVKTFNPRARALYESEGFVLEGCMRDCLKTADGFKSLYLMSMLRTDYVPSC